MMSRQYGKVMTMFATAGAAYEGVRTTYKLSKSPRMLSRRALESRERDHRGRPYLSDEDDEMCRDETRPFLVSSEVIPSLFLTVFGFAVWAPLHLYRDLTSAEMKLMGIESKTRDAVYGSLFDFVVE